MGKGVTVKKDHSLTTFDPKETAAEIHMTDAAVRAAKTAKDLSAFEAALRRNLEAKREFASDYQGKFKAGGDKRSDHSASSGGMIRAEDYCNSYGLAYRTVLRWCETLLTEAGFEKSFESKLKPLRQRFVDELQAANYSSESVEWYTPEEYIRGVHEVLGNVDLDPASCPSANETVGAGEIFTKDDDGLSRDWFGNVFLNPPYGITENRESLAGVFCRKAIDEYRKQNIEACIILVNSLHSQEWQRPLWQWPVCLVDHRIRFVSGDGTSNKNPTFQNAFFYLGRDIAKFKEVFSRFGYVVALA